jgi:hypothetical protein
MTEKPSQEIIDAYREHERALTIRNTRIGCIIGIVLVPMFTILDRQVYGEHVQPFLIARIICSGLMAGLYPLLATRLSRRYFRVQGLVLLALPTVAIAWMIYRSGDPASPYYAGLNLVLMVLAVVLEWTFWQSVAAVGIVLCSYLIVCLATGLSAFQGWIINNIAFLISTGIVIITGAYFQSRLRMSEFASRFQLDKNRRALAAQNQCWKTR